MSLLSRVVKTVVLSSEAPSAFEVRPYPFLSSLQTEILLACVSDEGAGDKEEGRVYTMPLPFLLGLGLWQGVRRAFVKRVQSGVGLGFVHGGHYCQGVRRELYSWSTLC